MPTLFDEAVEKVRRLPEDEQDAIDQIVLDELADEEVWQQMFTATASALDKLAERALEADERGETTPLIFPHAR